MYYIIKSHSLIWLYVYNLLYLQHDHKEKQKVPAN